MTHTTHRHDHHLPGMGHPRLTPLYDLVTRLLGVPALHRQLLAQAELRPGQSVLEIGCGTGNLALRAQRSHPDVVVTGLDPDVPSLDIARRKAARAGVDVAWDEGVAQDLPYADGSYDHVLSSLMLHHLEEDQRLAALQEARRVLATDGTLHVVDFGGGTDPSDGALTRIAARSPRLRGNYDDGLRAAIRDAGFSEVTETGHRTSRIMGRVTFYRATGSHAT